MNYPIYVDHAEYEEIKDEFYHIYKIYDGTEDVIQLIPEDYVENHIVMSDIVSIIPIYIDSMGNEEVVGEYTVEFEFCNITGEVRISPTYLQILDNYIAWYKESYKDVEGYEGYFVLQFNIEKYRDITVERTDITSEKAHRVATMQSAHASILEYMYQFTLAQETQERLNEIAYTIFLTITSTLLSMGITWGINKLCFSWFDDLMGIGSSSATQNLLRETEKSTSLFQRFFKGVGGASFNVYKVAHAVVSEVLEELIADEIITTMVTALAQDLGQSEMDQIFWSCFAESGRETFLSAPVDIMRSWTQSRTQTQSLSDLDIECMSESQKVDLANEIRQQQQANKRAKGLQVAVSSILMFAGALTGGFLGALGTAIGSGLIIMGGMVDEIANVKDLFKDVLKSSGQRPDNMHFELLREATSDWAGLDESQLPLMDPDLAHSVFECAQASAFCSRYSNEIEGIDPNDPSGLGDIMDLVELIRYHPNLVEAENLKNELISVYGADVEGISDSEGKYIAKSYFSELVRNYRGLDSSSKLRYSKDAFKDIVRSAINVVAELSRLRRFPLYYDPTNSEVVKLNDVGERVFWEYYDEESWGGLVYKISFNLPGTIYDYDMLDFFEEHQSDPYYGATGLRGFDRFIYHIRDMLMNGIPRFFKAIDSARDTFMEDGLYHQVKIPNKLHMAMISCLFYIGHSTETLRLMYADYKSSTRGERLLFTVELADKLVNDYNLINFEPIELTEIYEYAFVRERELALAGSTHITGLNSILPRGTPPHHHASLPFHDIALLYAFGLRTKDVHRVITEEFNIGISLRVFSERVFRVFGGDTIKIQEGLLRPVIESIIEERCVGLVYPRVPLAIDIFKAIQDIISHKRGTSWVSYWKWGNILLDADLTRFVSYFNRFGRGFNIKRINEYAETYYKRFAGVTWRMWEGWALRGLNSIEIDNILEISVHQVQRVYQEKGGYRAVQKDVRKRVTIDLLALGVDPTTIYYKTFGFPSQARGPDEETVYSFIRDYFEFLFDGMTLDEIIDYDWTPHYMGWETFYGLVKGRHY